VCRRTLSSFNMNLLSNGKTACLCRNLLLIPLS
jgi:hypothetical protein